MTNNHFNNKNNNSNHYQNNNVNQENFETVGNKEAGGKNISPFQTVKNEGGSDTEDVSGSGKSKERKKQEEQEEQDKNPLETLFNFVGQIGAGAVDTVANAVGSTGQMAGLLFAGKLERGEITDYKFIELASRFEKWLREKKRGEVSTFSRQERGEDNDYKVVQLKESGLLAGNYLFIFARSAPEELSNPFRYLEYQGKKYNGIVLVMEEWPQSRYNLEKELSFFVWRAGVKLGKDGPAPDYISSWLIDLTGSQFEKRELVEEIPQDSRRFTKDPTFISREKELELIGRSLSGTTDAARSSSSLPWIFSLTSEGGAGKSYFLNRVRQEYGVRLLPAGIDHDHYREVKGDLLALMAIVAEKFKLEGCPTPDFDKHYRLYLQVQDEAEKEEQKPSGAAVARHVGKIAGGAVTKKVATNLSKTFKKLWFVKHLPGIVGASASLFEIGLSLYNQLPKEQQAEIDLFLGSRPVQDLSNALVMDLANFVREQRSRYYIWKHPVVMFDTYEEGGPVLDQWIRSVLLANPLFLDLAPYLFIAGRFDLYVFDSRWTEYQAALQTIRLKSFSREESAEYLEKLGVRDPGLVNKLYELTGGLPLFLHLAAKIPDESLAVKILAERILEEVEAEWHEYFLEAAGLESFTPQTIKGLNNWWPRIDQEKADQLLENLISSSFVEFKQGKWQYLPAVRRILLKHRSQRGTAFKA